MPFTMNSSGPQGLGALPIDAPSADYHPADPSSWDGGVDPGSVNDALDYLITVAGGSLATKFKTHAAILYEGPPATDIDVPMRYLPYGASMVRVVAVTDAGTVDFNIEKRAKTTPDVAGTDIWSADKQATSGGLDQTSFDSGSISDDTWLHVDISAVSGASTLWIAAVWELT